MKRGELHARILALIPRDRYVSASDVVASLELTPVKLVWAEIVVLAMEGRITTDQSTRGAYDGNAMIRRVGVDALGR